jgi:hypothetical protein
MNSPQKQPVFHVIMPFGSDDESGKKIEIITTVAKSYGFFVQYPKYTNGKFDLQKSIQSFRHSTFIVVDLSFERPSCYYELGIAEAIGSEVYVFAINGTDIHQTSHRQNVIFYTDLEHFQRLFNNLVGDIHNRERQNPA